MRIATITALLIAALLAGCQSGAVQLADASEDQRVVAFYDMYHDRVYVARGDKVQLMGRWQEFQLSDDGHWLLLGRRAYHQLGGWASDLARSFVLRNLDDGRRWDVSFSPELGPRPSLGPLYVAAGPRLAVRVHGQESDTDPDPAAPPAAEPPEEVWTWSPDTGWQRAESWPADLKIVLAGSGEPTRNIDEAGLVTLPPKGLSPFRTVWVRPDGSTMEVLRQTDGLIRVAGLIVGGPLALSCGIGGLLFGQQGVWAMQTPWLWSLGPTADEDAESQIDLLIRFRKNLPPPPTPTDPRPDPPPVSDADRMVQPTEWRGLPATQPDEEPSP